jgi:hypothetical protein
LSGTPRLVRVTTARNPTEAALIQSALRDAGIPSIDRPTRAFDILDLLATGPRDILVDQDAGAEARALLGEEEPVRPIGSLPAAYAEPPSRLLAKLALGLGAGVAIAWAVWQILG